MDLKDKKDQLQVPTIDTKHKKNLLKQRYKTKTDLSLSATNSRHRSSINLFTWEKITKDLNEDLQIDLDINVQDDVEDELGDELQNNLEKDLKKDLEQGLGNLSQPINVHRKKQDNTDVDPSGSNKKNIASPAQEAVILDEYDSNNEIAISDEILDYFEKNPFLPSLLFHQQERYIIAIQKFQSLYNEPISEEVDKHIIHIHITPTQAAIMLEKALNSIGEHITNKSRSNTIDEFIIEEAVTFLHKSYNHKEGEKVLLSALLAYIHAMTTEPSYISDIKAMKKQLGYIISSIDTISSKISDDNSHQPLDLTSMISTIDQMSTKLNKIVNTPPKDVNLAFWQKYQLAGLSIGIGLTAIAALLKAHFSTSNTPIKHTNTHKDDTF